MNTVCQTGQFVNQFFRDTGAGKNRSRTAVSQGLIMCYNKYMKKLSITKQNTWLWLLGISLGLFALAGLFYLSAMNGGLIYRSLYPGFSIRVIKALGRISSLLPFSVFESGITLVILAALAWLARILLKKQGLKAFGTWLCAVLLICAYLTCSFVVFWGVNHFGKDLYTKLDMAHQDYTKEDLYQAGLLCIENANRLAENLPKNEKGGILMPSLQEQAKTARSGFASIADACPAIPMPGNAPKPLLYTPIYSYTGFTGFIFAFTGESCVSANTYPSALPLTMTHELSHAIAVASEDEANFLGFLACLNNDSPLAPYFQYSAWYHGYMWCANSLIRIDADLGYDLVYRCGQAFAADLRATNDHYRPYDGKVQEAAQQVNDSYLKFYKEEAGVETYDHAVSYVVNWYLDGCPFVNDNHPTP